MQDIDTHAGSAVVVIASECMGEGSSDLGKTLMKNFLFALGQHEQLPDAVLLYNKGVMWACTGSEALDDLRTLEAAGVEVLSCGTCLAYYDATERVAVGAITNMYAIVKKQLCARVVIRP